MRPTRRIAWLSGALASLACAGLRAGAPDDWDGVGFVRAVRTFSVASFSPHAPGYPGWVLSARALRAILPASVRDAAAASLVSAVALGVFVGALGMLSSRARPAGTRATPDAHAHAGPWLAALALGAPLVSLAATSVGTDLAGLAFTALSCALLAHEPLDARRAAAAGASAAFSLSLRPSGAVVLACALGATLYALRVRLRGRLVGMFVLGAVVVLTACAAYVFAHHAPRAYLDACATQWRGHFDSWGNTALSSPSAGPGSLAVNVATRAARVAWNGLGDGLALERSWLGLLRAVFLSHAVYTGARALARRTRSALGLFALGAFLWATLAQNAYAPRHALAFTAALLFVAARGLAQLARTPRRALAVTLACVAWIQWPTAALLRAHRDTVSPAFSLAERARSRDAVLFGGRAARFGELVGVTSYPRTWMGEVESTLERLDRLPREIYLTSEVQHRARARGTVAWVQTFCRDPRLERGRDACVALYRYTPRMP